jgi:beta-lysine 5,6-aminomutase beta subunit
MNMILPYGDTLDDGKVQLSFTIPMKQSPEAMEAAKRLCEKWGFQEVSVVHSRDLGEGFSFHILYGKAVEGIDGEKNRSCQGRDRNHVLL